MTQPYCPYEVNSPTPRCDERLVGCRQGLDWASRRARDGRYADMAGFWSRLLPPISGHIYMSVYLADSSGVKSVALCCEHHYSRSLCLGRS
jgi:hypothetical protein